MTTDNTKDVDLESVMRRVRKLLAIAEDHRADPAEAAAAAGMAERIMRESSTRDAYSFSDGRAAGSRVDVARRAVGSTKASNALLN
jgi:hypothetical protein